MACTDYQLHEKLTVCTHPDRPVMLYVRLEDGCSGSLCADCERELNVRSWPEVAGRILGPADGLNAMLLLRALAPRTEDEDEA